MQPQQPIPPLLPQQPIPPLPSDDSSGDAGEAVDAHRKRMIWGLECGLAVLRTWPAADELFEELQGMFLGSSPPQELPVPGTTQTMDLRHLICALMPDLEDVEVRNLVPGPRAETGHDPNIDSEEYVLEYFEYTPAGALGDEGHSLSRREWETSLSLEHYQELRFRNLYHALHGVVQEIQGCVRVDLEFHCAHDLQRTVQTFVPGLGRNGLVPLGALRRTILTGRPVETGDDFLMPGERGFGRDLANFAAWLLLGPPQSVDLGNVLSTSADYASEGLPREAQAWLGLAIVEQLQAATERARLENPLLRDLWDDGGGAWAWVTADVGPRLLLLGVKPDVVFLLQLHLFLYTGLMAQYQYGPRLGARDTNAAWTKLEGLSTVQMTLRLKKSNHVSSTELFEVAQWFDGAGRALHGEALEDQRARLRVFSSLADDATGRWAAGVRIPGCGPAPANAGCGRAPTPEPPPATPSMSLPARGLA